jgi:hypothetical protein
MYRKFLLPTWVVACLFGLGCTQDIIIDLPLLPTRMVLVSYLSPDMPLSARLTLSAPIESNDKPQVPRGATVTLYEGENLVERLTQVNSNDPTYWEAAMLPVPNKTYSIRVESPDYPALEATTSIPPPVKIKSLDFDMYDTTIIDLGDHRKALRIPITIEPEAIPADAPYFAFSLNAEVTNYILDDEGNPTDEINYTTEFEPQYIVDGRTIALLHDIPEPVILINEKYWDESTRTIRLEVIIPYDERNEQPTSLDLKWRTLSPAFYAYHLSLARQGNGSPFNDPDAVYSSFDDGYGVFGGYSTYEEVVQFF